MSRESVFTPKKFGGLAGCADHLIISHRGSAVKTIKMSSGQGPVGSALAAERRMWDATLERGMVEVQLRPQSRRVAASLLCSCCL